MKANRIVFSIVLSALVLCTLNSTAQSVLIDRATLNTLLGTSRVDEGFETLAVADFSSSSSDGLLSATNSWGGDTGLIVPGVTIESSFLPKDNGNGYFIEWKGNNYAASTTKTIAAGAGIIIDFWNPTAAFGLDLKDYGARRVLVAGVTVFGPDDFSVIYSNTNIPIVDPGIGTFFGFEALQGIGSAYFYPVVEGSPGYSPTIDNLSFGVVPEPSTIALAAASLGAFIIARRVRKT